jgi:mRNA interferase MazF
MGINIELSKTQQYLDWLKKKLYLNSIAEKSKNRIIKRGEVYKCDLGIGIGSEQNKERPCLIIQYNIGNKNSPNTIVAPITHSNSLLPIIVPLDAKLDSSGKCILDGNVLLGNIVCVSKARLGDFIVTLNSDEMKKIDKAIALSIDVKRHYDKLNNIHKDKLIYIDKLKSKIESLEKDITEKNKNLNILTEIKKNIESGNKDINQIKKILRL